MAQQNLPTDSSPFSRFMAGRYGRLARAAFGLAIIGAGVMVLEKPLGYGVAAFGLVPFAAGAFNLCPVAPVWGGHFIGAKYCPSKVTRR